MRHGGMYVASSSSRSPALAYRRDLQGKIGVGAARVLQLGRSPGRRLPTTTRYSIFFWQWNTRVFLFDCFACVGSCVFCSSFACVVPFGFHFCRRTPKYPRNVIYSDLGWSPSFEFVFFFFVLTDLTETVKFVKIQNPIFGQDLSSRIHFTFYGENPSGNATEDFPTGRFRPFWGNVYTFPNLGSSEKS